MKKSTLTNIQAWFRDYSDNLEISFRSSERIEHNVTKGERREYQILDTLSNLLPTRISVEEKVIIVDALDKQSPMFDGAFIDRMSWPRLYTVDKAPIALVESVLATIEIKSSLNQSELEDIFNKSKLLRSMEYYVSNSNNAVNLNVNSPLVTAFAYNCGNLNLSFFDFATLFMNAPEYSPSIICILNKGIFGLVNIIGKKAEPVYEPYQKALPALYHTGEDTLLVYLYFLSLLSGMEVFIAQVFTRYSNSLFSNMECFYFEADFLDAIKSSITAKNDARKCFTRKASADIKDLYAEARKALGL